MADMPAGRNYATSSVMGNRIYVIGGNIPSYSTSNECLDLYANSLKHRIFSENLLMFDKDILVDGALFSAKVQTIIDAGDGMVLTFPNETSGTVEPIGEVIITN